MIKRQPGAKEGGGCVTEEDMLELQIECCIALSGDQVCPQDTDSKTARESHRDPGWWLKFITVQKNQKKPPSPQLEEATKEFRRGKAEGERMQADSHTRNAQP